MKYEVSSQLKCGEFDFHCKQFENMGNIKFFFKRNSMQLNKYNKIDTKFSTI